MTQQQLDGAHIGARFEQMCGERVLKRMRCNRFEDPATSMRAPAGRCTVQASKRLPTSSELALSVKNF
jgi:hypothetical protein